MIHIFLESTSDSPDDKPLINLGKKKSTDRQTKVEPKASPAKKKRNAGDRKFKLTMEIMWFLSKNFTGSTNIYVCD